VEQLIPVAFAVGLFGGVHDLLTHRIPNWFTFPAILAGLAASVAFGGLSGLWLGFLGLGLGFIAFFPLWIFQVMGGGDVKLMMAIGAWSSPKNVFYVLIFSLISGGVFALFDVIARGRLKSVLRSIYFLILSAMNPEMPRFEMEIDSKRKFPFGAFIAIGQAATICGYHWGKLS
jgi:prepilin peptidase CpaA